MRSVLTLAGFFSMLFAPCLVAFHASLVAEEEEGAGLGYATSLRRLRSAMLESLRI